MKIGAFNRRTGARLVMLSWAVVLAWLARRELGKDEAQIITEATVRLSPDAHFFSVKAAGRQVGYASITIDTLRYGFRLSEVLALDVPEGDSTRRMTRRTDLVLSRSLRLREFVRTVSGGGFYDELGGTVEGDSVLRLRQRSVRDSTPMEWNVVLTGDVVVPEVLPYRLAFGRRLEVGRTVTANVFDLDAGTIEAVAFRATAESTFVIADSAIERRGQGRWVPVAYDTLRAWRIEHTVAGSPTVSWVDSHGGLVAAEAALGVRMERSAFEMVTLNYSAALDSTGPERHARVPAMESLVEAGIRPATGGATESITVSAEPLEQFLLPRMAWLNGGRQRVSGDQVEVRDRAVPTSGRPDRTEFLDPPPSTKPAIAALARSIAGDATVPEEVVRRLVKWSARVIGLSTDAAASEVPELVLRSKRATADGHVRLFVDLARALDLSARPVSGVAIAGGRVYGHAWSEVWLGAWVAVDPTFGDVPASTALIRVRVGGSSRAIDLVPLVGSATFATSPIESTR